jgi:hypothetical protein
MTVRRAGAMTTVAVLAACLTSGCGAVISTGPPLPHDVQERSTDVAVHGGHLKLHLASSPSHAEGPRPLVLYASGDGGWFGAAVGMFHTLARGGYPTVGFSSKEFMHLEQQRFTPLGVGEIADAYRSVIDAARAALHLPADTPVVIGGWSRGAALGALATSRIDASASVAGLVAIGLAAEEHLDLLPKLAPLRVVVLQASGDSYLPASHARTLLGADALVDAVRWVAENR